MGFNEDLDLGKEFERFVLKNLGYNGAVIDGKNPDYDIIFEHKDRTYTIEVKYSTNPIKYIAVEFFNLIGMKPTALAVSKSDYWVNVISEKPDFKEKTIWIIKTDEYKKNLLSLLRSKRAIFSIGGDTNSYVYINAVIEDVKEMSKKIEVKYKEI